MTRTIIAVDFIHFGVVTYRILDYRDVKKSYGLELRMTQNRAEKASFDTKGKELDSLFNKLLSDMSDLRERSREQDKKDLLAGNKTRFNTEGRDNDDLLNDAAGIQDETMASVARSRALVEASHEIGTATLEVLVTQREQINDVSNEIDAIDNNLTRAEKLITAFGKRMATDRILQFFTAVNVILIIAVVAYAATHKKKLEGGSSGDGGGDSP